MSSVGAYLRGLREKQGMSIDELSRATRVLHHYLEALEADNIGALPAPVFTKGFIRAYCQAIGIPPEEALQLYDRIGVPAPDVAKAPAGAVRIPSVPQIPRRQIVQERDYLIVTPPVPSPQGEPREKRARGTLLISFVLLVVLGVAFFAVTLTLQSGRQADSEPSAQVAPPQFPAASEAPVGSPVPAAAPAESPVLQSAGANQLAKPSPSASPTAPTAPSAPAPGVSPMPGTHTAAGAPATPATPVVPGVPAAPKSPATPSAATTPSAANVPPAASAPAAVPSASVAAATTARGLGLPYRLIARTTETTWMRVRTEDGRTSEETIPANEIREWISNGPFVITIGNAGGVSLELNGRPIPRLGASGAVVTRLVLPSDNP
jgi:cytoskeleton protein RodZ